MQLTNGEVQTQVKSGTQENTPQLQSIFSLVHEAPSHEIKAPEKPVRLEDRVSQETPPHSTAVVQAKPSAGQVTLKISRREHVTLENPFPNQPHPDSESIFGHWKERRYLEAYEASHQ